MAEEKSWKSVHYVSEATDANAANRRSMEDAHLAIDNFGGLAQQGLFSVFDGHGGQQIVNFLEENFASVMETNLANFKKPKPKDVMEAIIKTFTEVDQKSSHIDVSGSTVACCLVRQTGKNKKTLFVANVGDTRVVLATANKNSISAERLTYDHTALDPGEVNRIEKAGGFILRKRILGILSVARAIGDHAMKKYVISRPHTVIRPLTKYHKFMIIACDGVWDVFEDQEAVDFISKGLSSGTFTAKDAALNLVNEAKKKDSQDNITVLVVFFQQP